MPAESNRDDRKSASLAAASIATEPGARLVCEFAAMRAILRSPKVRQAGAAADQQDLSNPDEISFFFLDGEKHRKRRTAVAGMFSPKAIKTRHMHVMTRTMDAIVAKLQRSGSCALDELSWHMAVNVAAEIIGLTNSDTSDNLARRVQNVLETSMGRKPGWLNKIGYRARLLFHVGMFWHHDLSPAIKARRKQPMDDVITHMVTENYSKKGMIMEALSYGGAGMMTTREFIVMSAWHLFEKPDLLERFLTRDEADQFAILEEILRLDPVASFLYRRADDAIEGSSGEVIPKNELLCLSIRDANTDPAATGTCPYALDPDRAKRMKAVGAYMSFGEGPHRCPGAQVALHETRVFLDRLFRLPGIRLVSEPDISWNPHIQGYELRGAVVTCHPA
ncbi:MAG: cytochrome P450 [Sphingorhabdus sp.]|nr:cytochrome P450 [Sphingorhabdus sp.]